MMDLSSKAVKFLMAKSLRAMTKGMYKEKKLVEMNLRLDRFSTNKKFNHIETAFAYRSDPRAHCYKFRGLLGKTITFHICFFPNK